MAVRIRIKNNDNITSESEAALRLKDVFEISLSSDYYSGEILIITNVTLFGQDTKDIDIVVIGRLQNAKFQINSTAKDKSNNIFPEKNRDVYLNNFCWLIELKDHSHNGVKHDGLSLLVKYNSKWSDATSQSERQKYAMVNYLSEHIGYSPTICNFIWLRNLSGSELSQLNQNRKDNLFPSSFSFNEILTKSAYQRIPYKPDNKSYCIINCVNRQNSDAFNQTSFDKVFDLFSEVREASGILTRKKIEQITSSTLDGQKYAQSIGNKLVVIAGRAGTGKTVRLLRIACDLAVNSGSRSLILTYNHALVSDIRRVLALAGIPDGVDSYTVQISTLHKFFIQIIRGLGLGEIAYDSDKSFNELFSEKMDELMSYLDSNLIEEKDIQDLMRREHEAVGWDYILIDEAQDWNDVEKKVLFRIFGAEKIVVADGVDQFIRASEKQNWTRGLRASSFHKKTETKGLRQKYNLVSFVNSFAKVSGLNWKVTPDKRLIGGRVIASTRPYDGELHKELLEKCLANNNSSYDLLLLTPPQLVDKSNTERIHFKYAEDYLQQGIRIFDGTNTNTRTQYPTDLNQSRLFQYDSCRGLEAWTTVCLEYDQLFNYKMDSYEDSPTGELALETPEERRNRYVSLWMLMPMTRAIDTMVITLKDANSEVARRLREVGETMPDVIEWIE